MQVTVLHSTTERAHPAALHIVRFLALAALLLTLRSLSLKQPSSSPHTSTSAARRAARMAPARMPVAFVCHGGGPMPVTRPAQQGGLPDHLRALGNCVRAAKPKAVLVVSAHWEVRGPCTLALQRCAHWRWNDVHTALLCTLCMAPRCGALATASTN
jgi:hypothetical protein